MITKVSCPSENNLAANYLLDYLSWFLSVMFCIALVLRSPFWHIPWFWLLHQHTHWHCVVWNTWWCSPESPLRSHLRLLGSVFLSGIFQEEGLAQHSWSLPLTSLQSQNRQKCWCRIVRNVDAESSEMLMPNRQKCWQKIVKWRSEPIQIIHTWGPKLSRVKICQGFWHFGQQFDIFDHAGMEDNQKLKRIVKPCFNFGQSSTFTFSTREMDESESGQMVLEKVKWTYFDAYLWQTMKCHTKNQRKGSNSHLQWF